MKKIVIISASPRKGNSDALCDEFLKGAQAAGNEAVKIRLADKKINYCRGCDYCSTHGAPCVQKDDAAEVIQNMIGADVIVLASPVYFYSINAQLKTLIDRCCSLYTLISNKEFYYILTAADTEKANMEKSLETLRGFTLDCLSGAKEKGVIYGLGVWHAGEIAGKTALKAAYEAGKNA